MRIATIQDTVNHELDKVEGTCGRAYIALTHNHKVEIVFFCHELYLKIY